MCLVRKDIWVPFWMSEEYPPNKIHNPSLADPATYPTFSGTIFCPVTKNACYMYFLKQLVQHARNLFGIRSVITESILILERPTISSPFASTKNNQGERDYRALVCDFRVATLAMLPKSSSNGTFLFSLFFCVGG